MVLGFWGYLKYCKHPNKCPGHLLRHYPPPSESEEVEESLLMSWVGRLLTMARPCQTSSLYDEI